MQSFDEIKHKTTKEFNKIQGNRLYGELLDEIEKDLSLLHQFATTNQIPEDPALPHPMPMVLNDKSIRNTAYRNYMVRRTLKSGHETLKECLEFPNDRLNNYQSSKLTQQGRTMKRLLGLLEIKTS